MASNPDDFRCGNCSCDAQGYHPTREWHIPGLITSRQCLRILVPADTWQWIDLYSHYQDRLLPYAGGILDQPAAFMRAMDIIKNQSSS